MEYLMQQLLVTAAVITENGKILLARRPEGGSEAGKWEFPGGKVRAGEEPRTCLARELQEELGIETAIGPVLDLVSVLQPDRQLLLAYFAVEIARGTPQPLECQAVEWFTPAEIERLEKPEADQRFWEEYKNSSRFKV
jgi:8-oxo-dGTP diphosphatase